MGGSSGSSSGSGATSVYPACTSSSPSKAESDAAHGAFLAGRAAYDEADYATAINYFKDAYRRDCTKHELLNFIARAYEAKGDRAEAVLALETFLKRSPNDPSADSIQRRIANLKAQIAAEKKSGAPSPGPSPGPVSNESPSANKSSPPPAEGVEAELPPPTRSHSAAPWIVTGVGGAALITGVVLLVVGAGKVSESQDACPDILPNGVRRCDTEALQKEQEDKNASGRSLETAGIIVGSVGVAAVAGGLLWHFLEPTEKGGVALLPGIAPGYGGLTLRARY